MKSIIAGLDGCTLCELFRSMRESCAECSRSCDDKSAAAAAERTRELREQILDICRRPIFPLECRDLDDAACHGGRRYVAEVVDMARAFMRDGGRVVVLRLTTLNAPPEIVKVFTEPEHFEEYISRWI